MAGRKTLTIGSMRMISSVDILVLICIQKAKYTIIAVRPLQYTRFRSNLPPLGWVSWRQNLKLAPIYKQLYVDPLSCDSLSDEVPRPRRAVSQMAVSQMARYSVL